MSVREEIPSEVRRLATSAIVEALGQSMADTVYCPALGLQAFVSRDVLRAELDARIAPREAP